MHEKSAGFRNSLLGHATALLIFAFILSGCATTRTEGPLKNVKQLVLVVTPHLDSIPGTMECFEREDDNSSWHAVTATFPVVVGRKGLGCGRGLHHPEDFSGPLKREGDGKAPAGIFHLTSAFGLEAPEKMKDLKIPYLHLDDAIECVDDVKSSYYNSIVDRQKVPGVDWNSSEKMKTIGEQYRLGIFVEHNTGALRQSGGGSCIFLHIWKNPGTGTSGCTAMAPENMERLIHWLDANKIPTLVQLTEGDLPLLKTRWNLPSLKK
jgi:D-alanyl-D-alanine dipeptidase